MKELINSLGSSGLKSAYQLLQTVALYLTLALTVVLLIVFFVLKAKNSPKLLGFKKVTLGVIIGYSVTLIATIMFLMTARLNVKEELDKNYFILLGFFALLLIYALAFCLSALKGGKVFKIVNYVGLSLSLAYGIVLLFVLPTQEDYSPLSTFGMYGFSILLIIVIGVLAFITDKEKKEYKQTKVIAFAGVSISLSFALSFVKFFTMGANGGSITLASLLPLMLFSYAFGAKKGVFAGAIYGLLQCIQNPQIYEPMQVLLDYPIAFGAIGISGAFKNAKFLKDDIVKFVLGATLAVTLRYFSHVLSGYYVFSSWAWEGYGALAYSLVYNLFCFIDLAVVLVVGTVAFSNKGFIKELNNITN